MCIACQQNLSPEAMEAFGGKFIEILNHSITALMISIGDRTDLFSTMKNLPDATSGEIAERAGLSERYVREWLGGMTAAGIVECNAAGTRFTLPAVHAAMLTRGGESDCLAHLTQYISILGSVEDGVVESFKRGGGVPYAAYPRFHDVMAKESFQTVVMALEDHILPLVPGMKDRLRAGARLMDIGCGRGMALCSLAEAYPDSQFTGRDFSQEAIDFASSHAKGKGLTNVRFEVRDLTRFDVEAEEEVYDFITAFDAIHDQIRPDRVLSGIHRALKADGVFLMQDIGASSNIADNRDHLLGPLLYGISLMHCMTVSLSAGGMGLGAMWGEEVTKTFLANAGFAGVDVHTLEHDPQNYYYVNRKRAA